MPVNPRDHAVVVGITKYPDPLLGDLHGCVRDALAFREWLVDEEGGGVPAGQVHVVTSPDHPLTDPLTAEPRVDDVDEQFDRLIRSAKDDEPVGRRLYIFFAGHGYAPDIENAALFMANAGRRALGYHIPGRPYANWFRTAALFDEVVLLMDCCRDNYPRAAIRQPPWDDPRADPGPPAAYFYGFATEWNRKARELPIEAFNNEVRGIFTAAIIEGLRGGARDEHGQVTSQSLESFVYNYLPRFAPLSRSLQEPKFAYDKARQITFGPPKPPDRGTRVTITVPALFSLADYAVENHQFLPVDANGEVLGDSWTITLPKGFFRILHRPTGRYMLFQVIGAAPITIPLTLSEGLGA